MSSRVEGRFLEVTCHPHHVDDCVCVQCGARAEVMLLAGEDRQTEYSLCSEDAIDLALELVREAKAAMKEEKKREVVR